MMNALKRLPFLNICILILFGWGLSVSISQAAPEYNQAAEVHKEVLFGFKEWKAKRVKKAKKALENYKLKNVGTIGAGDPNSGNGTGARVVVIAPANKEKAGEAIRQLEFNVEIALGLTVHDYFALYLKDKSKVQIREVVKQLSPEELSELLLAYRKALYDIPTPPPAEAQIKANQL